MILVDTTFLVDLERGREGVHEVLGKVDKNEPVVISAISLRELHVGIGYTREKLGFDASRRKSENMQKICDDYGIIDVSQEILIRSGEKEGELLAKGVSVDAEDIIIGITAEKMKVASLITRNPDHFDWCGVKILTYSI